MSPIFTNADLDRGEELLKIATRDSTSSRERAHELMALGAEIALKRGCSHRDAETGCGACTVRVRRAHPLFPLQAEGTPGPRQIPWEIAEKAWNVYAAKYGTQQSAERIAERGGFGWSEMDSLLPGWREQIEKLSRLKIRIADLELKLQVYSSAVDRLHAAGMRGIESVEKAALETIAVLRTEIAQLRDGKENSRE